jgi:dynein heavy chain
MVEAKMASVQKDLDDAIPLVEKAQKALQGLKIEDFRTLKALKNPPPDIAKTFTCVLHLLCGTNFKDVKIETDKNGKLKTDNPWKTALGTMGKPEALMDALNGLAELIDQQKLNANNFKAVRPTIQEETFTPENLKTKSECAAGLCDFILNIVAYYDVVESVEPKRNAVKEAEEQLAAANAKKAEVDALVADLNAKLAILMADFDKAMNEKETAMAEAAKCERKLDLA